MVFYSDGRDRLHRHDAGSRKGAGDVRIVDMVFAGYSMETEDILIKVGQEME